MALEAVVYPQTLFGCGGWSFYELGGFGFGLLEEEEEEEERGLVSAQGATDECNMNSSLSMEPSGDAFGAREAGASREASNRRKRPRTTKRCNNKEEVDSQRMTHIAVERNRRKQMNEYLAVLRSLMPASYAQRGDQASTVGGAINYVKELEQHLQTLEAKNHIKKSHSSPPSPPFASFFNSPQYSSNNNTKEVAVDIEATMIDSHVNLKVRARRQPKQLLRILMGLQSLRLTTLHLNVTTGADQTALYSFSLKVEDYCQLTSVDEIAEAVYQMVWRIQNESVCTGV
uniref:BHLH transcription factor n=1 Tax=Dracaena cambodiana TaxID=580341 RepID=A0A7M3UQI0_9ASPA|nr:bHLH transcription factor [Dracaena cambodiana]